MYFNELAHTVTEAGKFTICRAGWRTEDPEKSQCEFQSKGSQLAEYLLARGGQTLFYLDLLLII